MAERIDVFISSTSKDLKKYRAKVKEAVLTLGLFPIAMEEFQPGRENALQKCYDELLQAEVFVGIYAHRYGYAPDDHHSYTTAAGEERRGDGETSITHLEYLWAIERGLPIYLFVLADKDEDDEPIAWPLDYVDEEPERSRLKAFKHHIMDQHVVKFFHSVDDLGAKVTAALAMIPPVKSETVKRGRRDFYQHVYLPPHYVPRPELLDELRLTVLGDEDVALTSAVRSARALHGMGGIGKSVMARALCDDLAVQAAFPDGILWTELGSEPTDGDIRTRLREWIEALGGTVSEMNPTYDQLKSNLTSLLADRACLLIVDDVWQRRHAEHFQAGGPRCRLLMTTRDAEVARSLGAEPMAVPTMTEAEAFALLRQWAGSGLDHAESAVLLTIVNKLGRLPLALKLAGAQLQKGDPQRWLQRFNARKLKTKRPEGDIHDSLEQTFGLSLEALDAAQRHLYAALAIFKEDEPVREMAIHRLWSELGDLDEDESEEFLDDLAARALLEIAGAAYPRAAVLHDLLRDFMRAELEDARPAHQALLDAYAGCCEREGEWPTAADDGYLYEHLVYHLEAVGNLAAVRDLFNDQSWMHVRVPADDYRYDGYLADLSVYWDDAEARTLAGDADAFAEVMRCALIHTSPNMLAGNLPPKLVARAVELGYWSIERALSLTRRIPRSDYRHEMYLALLGAGLIPDELMNDVLRQAIEVAYGRYDGETQISALLELAPFVPSERYSEIYGGSLANVRRIDNPEMRAEYLFRLAPLLPEQCVDLQREALVAAAEIPKAKKRVEMLIDHLQELPDELSPDAMRAVRDAAIAIPDDDKRLSAQAQIAALLPPDLQTDLVRRILDEARELDNLFQRVSVLGYVLPLLPEADRASVLAEMLVAVRQIDHAYHRAQALVILTRYMPSDQQTELLTESLEVIHKLENTNQEAMLLSLIARDVLQWASPDIYEIVIQKSLRISEELKNSAIRAELLNAVVPDMRAEHVARTLPLVKLTEDGYYLRRNLDLIAPLLSLDHLPEAFTIAYSIDYEGENSVAISDILQWLSPDLYGRALEAARGIGNRSIRLQVLIDLGAHFDEAERHQIFEDALTTVRAFARRNYMTRRLSTLLPLMPPQDQAPVVAEALANVRGIDDGHTRSKLLLLLIEFVPEGERGAILKEAQDAAMQIDDPALRVRAMVELLPRLPERTHPALLHEMIKTSQTVRKQTDRVDVWVAMAQYLPAEQRGDIMAQALNVTGQIDDPKMKTARLVRIAERLPIAERKDIIIQAYEAASGIQQTNSQARELIHLARIAPSDQAKVILSHTLNLTLKLEEDRQKIWLLKEIAPLLTEEWPEIMVRELTKQVNQMGHHTAAISLLMAIAPYVSAELGARVLASILERAEHIYSPDEYTTSMLPVIPLLAADQRPAVLVKLLDAVYRIDNAKKRAKVLIELLEYLPEQQDTITKKLRESMLDYLREFSHEQRARVLHFSRQKFFAPPILSEACLGEIARHILEIAYEWEWL